MTWEHWFIGGGAQHSPEVARLVSYAATSGSEGIVGATDLTVRPLPVPAGQVRVSPGASVIPNRSTGGAYQSYLGRLPTEDRVSIAPTGSAGGRVDMVIARVEDPFAAGTPWQDPDDPTVGPYIFTRVLDNVGAAAIASPDAARKYLRSKGYSAIPLAGITMPANTGTVTASMVKSLREMANPRRRRDVSTVNLVGTERDVLDSTTYEYWPDQAANAKWGAVEIPEWATELRVVAMWCQALMPAGSFVGGIAVQLGTSGDANMRRTQGLSVNTDGDTEAARNTLAIGDRIVIPAAFRGTNQPIRPIGLRSSSNPAVAPVMDSGSAFVMDIEFLEAPTEDDS